jgi:hypothetical protein
MRKKGGGRKKRAGQGSDSVKGTFSHLKDCPHRSRGARGDAGEGKMGAMDEVSASAVLMMVTMMVGWWVWWLLSLWVERGGWREVREVGKLRLMWEVKGEEGATNNAKIRWRSKEGQRERMRNPSLGFGLLW